MSLSLKLELKANKKVLVTNSDTNEQREVTVDFIQQVTGDSLLMLMQYRYYELLINAEKAWNRIKSFNAQREEITQIYIEQKFKNAMVDDSWSKITDYEKEMYSKALAWVDTYNPKTSKRNINKTAIAAAATGAASGALVSNSIGGIGVVAAGTGFGVGTLGLVTMGTVAGLAVYGMSKAFD